MYTLADVCTLITDGSHFSPEDELTGYPMLSVKDMGEEDFIFENCKHVGEEAYRKLIANGCKPLINDVVLAKDGSYLKTAFPIMEEREIACLSSIAILRPNLQLVIPSYLSYYLKSESVYKTVSLNYISGTALKRIILKGIKKIPITLPDIAEQQCRVALLDSTRRIINLRKEQLKRFDELIKARFVEVISQSNSIDIKLKDVVETDRIITYGMVKPGKDVEGGVIIIKVKDFPNGIIQTNDFLHSDPELESKYARSRVKAGDLLYSIRGTVGRTAFVTPELEGANITQDTARLSIDTKRFNPNYIRFALGYDEVVRTVESQIKGVAMKGISLSELREIEIPCVDYDAQQVFGEFVEQVDKSKSVIQKSLEETQLLFDSLMQEYFG